MKVPRGFRWIQDLPSVKGSTFSCKQNIHNANLVRAGLLTCLVFLLSFFMPLMVSAQPTGYQEYYVLGYEEHVWQAFLNIYEGPDDDIPGEICSTVSLVATADYQVIYYDHWEDGYEADLLNPIQSSTEIHGDGNPSNGGSGNDVLLAGDDVNLTSDQAITGPTAIQGFVPVDPAREASYIRYDGGDRIITSGGPVDLTHAMWPLDNSWIGGAWEVYSRQAYADAYSYRLPIGEDLYTFGGGDDGTYGDFRNVYLQLSAFEDNTVVLIDNGTEIINFTLERGWTYSSMGQINSGTAPPITINAGTTIRSDKPVQVGLVTGSDSVGGDGFQGRFLIVLSDQLWGADYIVPVPSGNTGHQAEVYLANPNDFAITVNAYDRTNQSSFVIPASTVISSTLPYSRQRGGSGYVPQDSAARFTSSDGVFGVVVTADTSEIVYDWGFSGIPAKYLTRDYYVSWAPGTTDLSDNGSPIWVTPLADGTTFYIDYSPLDGVVDESFTLNVLQQRRIFDPDNDNTGTHIWATGEFAMAWGEDPRTANVSDPYLDLGLTTLPLQQRWLDPVLTLDKIANPTILPAAGGTVTFTLLAHSYNAPLSQVNISDSLPTNWSYVPDSTQVIFPDRSTQAPEPVQEGQTLFWNLDTELDVSQNLTLTFQAQISRTGGVELTAFDSFESGNYSGGANWATDWQEVNDDASPSSGAVALTENNPLAGRYSLRLRGSDHSIQRGVNLEQFALPTLSFIRRVDQLESGDRFYLDVHDGSNWQEVQSWTDGDLEGEQAHEIVDLGPYANGTTLIRFRSDSSVSDNDYLFIDRVQVFDAVGASVNRGEAIGRDEYSGTWFNPTDEATVYISSFDLTKTVSSAEAQLGDTLVYTLSYANLNSVDAATNVTLRDTLPIQHVTFQSASDGGTFDPQSGTVVWELGTLSAGATGEVTFTVKVNGFVQDGTILENSGVIESDRTRAGSNTVRTTVRAPQVRLSKAGPAVASQNQIITYTLTYENSGGAPATGTIISDTIPDSTSYVPGSMAINTGDGWTPLSDAADGDRGTFDSSKIIVAPGASPGTILPGERGQVRFAVQVKEQPLIGSLVLNVALLDHDLDIPRDSNTVVTHIADLLLSKKASQTAVVPGGVVTYTLTYENVSPTIPQTDVYVREPIPVHTNLLLPTVTGGDQVEYSWDNGNSWSSSPPVTPVTHLRWYDAELPPDTQGSLSFAVQVSPLLPPNTTLHNVARITSTQVAAYQEEWLPSNQIDVGTVDLWVEKLVHPSTAWGTEQVSYTLSYGNRGSADASGVQILDTLPSEIRYSSGSIWGSGADDSGDPTLAWNVETVAAGVGTQQVGYAAVVEGGLALGTLVTNTASLSSPYGIITSAPATVLITTTAEQPLLSLDKTVSADPIAPGETFTYSLQVVNSGLTAHSLTISDVVPSETSFVACEGAPCALVDDTVTWGPLDMAGGSVLGLALKVKANPDLPNGSLIVNDDYGLRATGIPPLSGPPVTTTVNVAVLSLTKWANRNEVFAGSRLDYSLLVQNSGGRATHLIVSDTLPAHTTFIGCDCAIAGLETAEETPDQVSSFCGAPFTCNLEEDQVIWRVEEMASGRSLNMTFWVTVDESLPEGAVIINEHYSAIADHLSPIVGTPTATTTVHELLFSISKEAWPNPVTLSQELIFTITVQNQGNLLRNVVVTDTLPGNVTFVACDGTVCELGPGAEPQVKWWLPDLPRGSEQELTVRLSLENVSQSLLINRHYGAWIPAAERVVTGPPVQVRVSSPSLWDHNLYLPIVLKDPLSSP